MRRIPILYISLTLLVAISSWCAAQEKDGAKSFQFTGMSLRASLDSLATMYGLAIVYLDKDVDGRFVSTSCRDCRFDEILDSLLTGTRLTWIRFGNQVVLKQREVRPERPSATVSGTVRDSLTHEWVAGAVAILQDTSCQATPAVRRWCPTNSYGFFSLRNVAPGTYTLVIRALGYLRVQYPVTVSTNTSVECSATMVQDEIKLQEVTVEGQRTATFASAERFSRGVYLRSIPSDQNLYLLDGARIYNPTHYGGVLSTFNAEALNDVQLALGGPPPYYGGHLGGIVDLAMRDGTGQRLSGSAGTGTLGTQLSLEGPVGAGTTFLLSGRRGYPDIAVPFLDNQRIPGRLGSTELVAKMTRRIAGGHELSMSGYLGRDSYDNQVGTGSDRLNNIFSWGNRALNLRWVGVASPALFMHASAVYTHYDFALEHVFGLNFPFSPGLHTTSHYAIDDYTVGAHAEDYFDEEHTVRAGVEVTNHRINADISALTTQTTSVALSGFSSWEVSVYLQDQWRMLPGVSAEVGGRATSFSGDGGTFSAIDPRFSLLVSLDDFTRLYGSLSAINQFLHPYRNSGVFLLYPTVFWYPSTEGARPSTSFQATLGFEKGLRANEYVVSGEAFFRTTNNLHEFQFDTAGAPVRDLYSEILSGTGKAYGVEFLVRKRTGDLTGSISYTLCWLTETVAELNGGNSFAPPFDRRHEVQVALSYEPQERWTFGFLCVLATGQSRLIVPLNSPATRGYDGGGFDVHAVQARQPADFFDLNGGRLPGFQRIELSVLHRFLAWNLPCQVTLRMLNGYGLLDPIVWQRQISHDVRYRWSAELEQPNLLPIYPTIGLIVRF